MFPTFLDPVAPLIVTPGTRFASESKFRPVGIAFAVSRLSTRCVVVLWTLTTGASPVTVIVSSSAPTRSSASTLDVPVPARVTPSRLVVLKPASVNVTV